MNRYLLLFPALLNTLLLFSQAEAQDSYHVSRPGSHAPIGLMGDHTHSKGEWMFSARYMYMNMEDLKQGSNDASFASALEVYGATPIRMSMEMQMLGVMYAPTSKLTLTLMSSYVSKEMDHITRMGGAFTTSSSGIGDTKLAGLYRLTHTDKTKLHAELGVYIPTGSINERDVNPVSAPNTAILPYPMQIGSGTWDLTVALTYLYETKKFNFGAQGRALLRTGTNSNGYRLGDQYDINGWAVYQINPWLGLSGRFQGLYLSEIEGANPDLNPLMVITADPDNSGGKYINGGLGINVLFPGKALKGLRLGLEVKHPLYQNLNGFQLKQRESIIAGIQYAIL